MRKTLETLNGEADSEDVIEVPPVEPELLVEPVEGKPTPSALISSADGETTEENRLASTTASDETADGLPDDGESLPEPMRAYPDRWYIPDSNTYAYAVRTPDCGRAYRKTTDLIARLLEQHYGPAGK
ncbi:hypothetical protein [Halorubrum distributum]|uniref:Uncharacterized protein n=1 Tax=Halorubrum distributum TaxID=29283 RepID=A0A6B1IPY5_9EURY|nr:hypothetical protein [Halorubrum terrestre]MYL68669.1 hypothetical protein [Halorubrum terrestre]